MKGKSSLTALLYRKLSGAIVLTMLVQLLVPLGLLYADESIPPAAPKYITFLYKDFAQNVDRLKLNGAASVNGGALRLTESRGQQFGSFFNQERVSLAGSGFSTFFTFKMSQPNWQGADGIVFTVQTSSNEAGEAGGGLGYDGIANSIGIEFDTYYNSEIGDPSDNHIALDINGNVRHGTAQNPQAVSISDINLNSGQSVYAWVDYETDSKQLKVYLSSTDERPALPRLTETVDLQNVTKSADVYVGFTAATGGDWQNHDIEQWFFTNKYDPIDIKNNTYAQAPTNLSVDVADLEDESVTDVVYYRAEIGLTDYNLLPAPGVRLGISDTVGGIEFLDETLASLPGLAEVITDGAGRAVIYAKVSANAVNPGYRLTTEHGVYANVELKRTLKPEIVTGEPVPQYIGASGPQSASIPVQLAATGGATVFSWGAEYRLKPEEEGEGGWIQQTGTGVWQEPGSRTVTLNNLLEDRYYEVRAFAVNTKGISYGESRTFYVQEPMPLEQIQFSRFTPSVIYAADAESIQVAGANLHWLLKRLPASDLSVAIAGGGQEYLLPTANLQLTGTNVLKIVLPAAEAGSKLPVGSYTLHIRHAYFGNKSFDFTITDDPAYRTANYEEIEVENQAFTREPNQVDSIVLRGPFQESLGNPGVYTLQDQDAVVSLNDNLLFKGEYLEVDKSVPTRHVIRGNGRLYVNGKNTVPYVTTFTLQEGEFEFTPENFRFPISALNTQAYDFTGMKMPVTLHYFTFIKNGIRIAGEAQVEFKTGGTKFNGKADVKALEFAKDRFDLAADFSIGANFKSGPLEAGELRFGIDTRTPEFGVGATAELKKSGIGFEIDLLIKDKALDSISFAVAKQIKIGSTGAQITKLGGGVSNMSKAASAPLTFSALGGLSDYLTPKIGGNYMINGKDLKLEFSSSHFGGSGKLGIYSLNVANTSMFIVFNPAGYRGYTRAGFEMGANVNLLDVLIGELMARYFYGSSFSGYANARLQIPSSVWMIGGKKLASVSAGVDEKKVSASSSVIGIGFVAKYTFSTKAFNWDVKAPKVVTAVASAVVNTGKTVFNAVKSLFWLDDPARYTEWTIVDTGAEPDIKGEKLFSASDIRPTEAGVYVPGALTVVVAENNLLASKEVNGLYSYKFLVESSFTSLIQVKGAASGIRLAGPQGEVSLPSTAVYADTSAGEYYMEALLTPGEWRVVAEAPLGITVYRELFRNSADDLAATAQSLQIAALTPFTPLDFTKRGKYLAEISGTVADVTLLKADGRPYAAESRSTAADYNSRWDADNGAMLLLADVPDAGRWYSVGGADSRTNLYLIRNDVGMEGAIAWLEGGEYISVANFSAVPGTQVMLEIQGAGADTLLYRPDGTEYGLRFDSAQDDWNAIYDSANQVMHVLVDVNMSGYWKIHSSAFVDSHGLTLLEKAAMSEVYGADTRITYSITLDKKGNYLFEIKGSDEATRLYDTNGTEIPLVFEDEAVGQNAIQNGDTQLISILEAGPGTVKIETRSGASIGMYKLDEMPRVAVLSAASGEGRNTYEVSWQLEHARPDTRVRLLMTTDANDPTGQVVAEELPPSGILTVTLPEGNVPGAYYLALAADSESYGPLFQVLEEPLDYQTAELLAKPEEVQAKAIGNGDVEMSFRDSGFGQAGFYRIYPADEDGNVDYNGLFYDGEAGNSEEQSVILSGLPQDQLYRFRVMALRPDYDASGEALVSLAASELSDPVGVFLPQATPVKLDISWDTGAAAKVEHSFYPYYASEQLLTELSDEEKADLQQTLVITAADDIKVKLLTDAPAALRLYLDGQEVSADSQQPALFPLGRLPEGLYELEASAVDEDGDMSSRYGLLSVDRTAPHLYLKSPENGEIIGESRVKLEGGTETGASLRVNGDPVAVDAWGRFVHYVRMPESGVLELTLEASDEAGNLTVNRLEVASTASAETGASADLAGLAVSEGELTAPFNPEGAAYTAVADVRNKQLRVQAPPMDAGAAVTIDGKTADAGYSAIVDAADGKTVPIVVTSSGGQKKTYHLVLATESELAALDSLRVEGFIEDAAEEIELNRVFRGTTREYEAEAGHETTAVQITPAAPAGSLIRVNGTAVPSGHASAKLPLAVGENTIVIQVLSPNEAAALSLDWEQAASYTLKLFRQANGNHALSSLTIDGVAMTPGIFDPEVLSYSARVSAETASVQLHFAAADPAAQVEIGGELKGAEGTGIIQLEDGANPVSLIVRAEDGTAGAYQVVIYRDRPLTESLLLSELEIVGFQLDADFHPGQRFYTMKGTTAVSRVTVLAKPADSSVTVKVNGKPIDAEGHAVADLAVGINNVLVQVESADQSETNIYSISVTRTYWYGGVIVQPDDSGLTVKINGDSGNKGNKLFTAVRSGEEAAEEIRAVANSSDFRKELEERGHNAVISLHAGSSVQRLSTVLTADLVSAMQEKEASLLIDLGYSYYYLPAAAFDLQQIADVFAPSSLEEVEVSILMRKLEEDEREALRRGLDDNLLLLGEPMEFSVSYIYKNRTVAAERFVRYVPRGLQLPEGVQADESVTVVRVNEDGGVAHVPTSIRTEDGQVYAVANSFSNSVYALVKKSLSFNDIKGRWSESVIEDLAARLVVDGVGLGSFAPERKVTRAEFAAMTVRALGLADAGGAAFSDAAADAWYTPVLSAAQFYGLVNGYSDGTIRPDATITRAEAAAIISRAWRLTGSGTPLAEEALAALTQVTDRAAIPQWAEAELAACVKLGLITGYEDGSVRPQNDLTREETAALLRNLLVQSELIGIFQ